MNERENKDPRINLGEIATFREGKVRNKRLVGKEIRRGCRQRGRHSEEKKTGKELNSAGNSEETFGLVLEEVASGH